MAARFNNIFVLVIKRKNKGMKTINYQIKMEDKDLDARLKKLEQAERSIDDAFSTGKAE